VNTIGLIQGEPRSKAGANVHDLQISATCITHGFAILTSNDVDFKKVPGLEIVKPDQLNE